MRRHSACLVPRFFTGERVGQRVFLQVLVTGIVTNRKQKIPSQITGKIVFITYCFSNFHAKLFFYRLCTSTLVNSFHLIVIVPMAIVIVPIVIEAPMATHSFAAADAFRPYYGLISAA